MDWKDEYVYSLANYKFNKKDIINAIGKLVESMNEVSKKYNINNIAVLDRGNSRINLLKNSPIEYNIENELMYFSKGMRIVNITIERETPMVNVNYSNGKNKKDQKYDIIQYNKYIEQAIRYLLTGKINEQ